MTAQQLIAEGGFKFWGVWAGYWLIGGMVFATAAFSYVQERFLRR